MFGRQACENCLKNYFKKETKHIKMVDRVDMALDDIIKASRKGGRGGGAGRKFDANRRPGRAAGGNFRNGRAVGEMKRRNRGGGGGGISKTFGRVNEIIK